VVALLASLLGASSQLPGVRAAATTSSYSEACDAQYENVETPVELTSGETIVREIEANATQRWTYSTYNLTTMSRNDTDRKLLISLEPCYGSVFLFVRKNIGCHPDPYSCIDLETGKRDASACRRTHFMSVIDGSRDGAPTFFQISLSSTRYFISVYATTNSRYSLTVLDDVGAWPRRGDDGIVNADATQDYKVMLNWAVPTYFPEGVAETSVFYIYAVRLTESDVVTSDVVFLNQGKILNTVCGLANITDRPNDIVGIGQCDTSCNATLTGIENGATYAFNVVAESTSGFKMAYSGVTLQMAWSETSSVSVPARRLLETTGIPLDNKGMQVAGAVLGSVLGMVGMFGMVLLRLSS